MSTKTKINFPLQAKRIIFLAEKIPRSLLRGASSYPPYSLRLFLSQGCKNSWVKKSSVIEQLLEIINEKSLDKLGMKEHIEREIKRYYKFKYGVLGITADREQEQKKIDVKNYAKYILKEGAVYEKRELLSC